MDLATTKKTPTLGLHRIAKLLGNENKMNRSAGLNKTYITLQCHHYNRHIFYHFQLNSKRTIFSFIC